MLPINCINVTNPNGKYTFLPISAEMAASVDNAAISIPIERYNAQLTGLDIPYHLVTCDIETNATVKIGTKKAPIIKSL
jgi:hypothetical protein